jgi:hypothetical protein
MRLMMRERSPVRLLLAARPFGILLLDRRDRSATNTVRRGDAAMPRDKVATDRPSLVSRYSSD